MNNWNHLGRRLAATIEHNVLSGQWSTGSKIPAERELASQFGVSRQTVRGALDELEAGGLVTRRHGSGTYVAPRRLEQSLLSHFSIVESLRSTGSVVGTTLLSKTIATAQPAVASELQLDDDAPVLELERLRTVDGEPFMLEHTWLPSDLLPGIVDTDLAEESLYSVMRTRYDIVLIRAIESFEPVLLTAREAALLQGNPKRPALMLTRTTYDSEDRPLETARALLRADRCRTLVERRVHEPNRP